MIFRFQFVLRIVLGGIFLYAGAIKAWDPSLFLVDVQNYRLLPAFPAWALTIYLPWLEITCGICLVLKKLYFGTLSILFGLMVVFMAAMACAWARGLNLSCGCFGHHETPSHYFLWLLWDLIILLGLATCFQSGWEPTQILKSNGHPSKIS